MSNKLTMRQHKIRALKCAKAFLINKYGNLRIGYGICFALNQYCDCYGHNTDDKFVAVKELKEYICKALYPEAWLNGWVYNNCNSVKRTPLSTDPKMFNTRIAWIDWMIDCLEEDERNECK